MYAGSPTIFNVPEIATLRRVKPLPKRRRMSMGSSPAVVTASTGNLIADADLEAVATALLVSPPPPPSQPLALATSQAQSLSSSLPPSTTSSSSTWQSPRLPASLGSATANLDVGESLGLGALSTLSHLSHHHLLPSEVACGDPTAEELLAHADSLSARMALQSYYMPMLGSVQEFLAAAAASAGISAGEMFKDRSAGTGADGTGPYVDLDSAEFMYSAGTTGYHGAGSGMGYGPSMGMSGGGREEDDDGHGDGDYVDHFQQPGNTKKRKVPANVSVSQREDAENSDHMPDEGEERGIPFGRVVNYDDSETSAGYASGLGYHHPNGGHQPLSPHASMVPTLYHGARRGKLTAATLAGLQHKEKLKTRKRQLAAVLGALSHGDTLALDQALSVNFPFEDIKNPGAENLPKVRLSKRSVIRQARAARLNDKENKYPGKRKQKLPACDFTFACPSTTADRLIATKEEVAVLRNKFEAELARQAAKEQSSAKGDTLRSPSASASQSTPATAKGSKGKKGRNKSIRRPEVAELPVLPLPSPTTTRGKKKKRSALANESNPHHLRNYVPSRPSHHSSSAHATQQQQNWVTLPPVRFLSAEIPARKSRKNGEPIVQPTAPQLTDPAEEWICAFCEYDLFYGDEVKFKRAVRNRKKILRRRRRARERAAAAASGRGRTNVGADGSVTPVPEQHVPPAHVQQNGNAESGGIYETSGPPAAHG